MVMMRTPKKPISHILISFGRISVMYVFCMCMFTDESAFDIQNGLSGFDWGGKNAYYLKRLDKITCIIQKMTTVDDR